MQLSTTLVIPDDVAAQLGAAGHLVLSLPDSADAILTRVFAAAKSFFHTPLEERISSRLPEECGYRPAGIEYSQSPDRPDQMESFTVSPRSFIQGSRLESRTGIELQLRMMAAFDVLESVAEVVAIKTAQAISGCAHIELRGSFHFWSRLQTNYSQPSLVKVPLINELHEDGSFLTLACANAPGLEFEMPKGHLVPVTASPPEILIMPGEIAWLLSGGKIPPLFHQVRPMPEVRERLSLLFFCDPDPAQCTPWVSNEVNIGVDIAARIRSNVLRFGLNGFSFDNLSVKKHG